MAAVSTILLVAVAFQVAELPEPVAEVVVAILAVAAVAGWVRLCIDPHAARTGAGMALVYTRPGPDGSPVRVLRQGGVFQSATYLDERRFEPVFAYQRAFEVVLGEGEPTPDRSHRVLAIGGGGFAWPKLALTSHADLAMDVVEVDTAVVEVARRWFFLDELEARAGSRLNVVVGDGRAFVEGPDAAPACYDAIVNDAFSGGEPVYALATVEAAHAIKRRLVPDGVYAVNVVSRDGGADVTFLRDEVATLLQAFSHVHVLTVEDDDWAGEDNYLVIATDGDAAYPDAIAFDEGFLGEPLWD